MIVVGFAMCGWVPCFSVKPYISYISYIALEALAKADVCGWIPYVELEH